MYHHPLFIKTSYLCEIADEQLLWRNYHRVFDKLYVFYCVVSRNFLHTFYLRSGKKCCCTVICEHSSFSWVVGSWLGKNGFKGEKKFYDSDFKIDTDSEYYKIYIKEPAVLWLTLSPPSLTFENPKGTAKFFLNRKLGKYS